MPLCVAPQLASSEDEDDAEEGGPLKPWRNRLKGLFSGPVTRPVQQLHRDEGEAASSSGARSSGSAGAATGSPSGAARACSVTLQMIEAESDVRALRALAAKAVMEQGEASTGLRRMENTACRLRAQVRERGPSVRG